MVVRPLDEHGDFRPISSLDQMITGKEAVCQIIDLRLTFYYGEWWEDREMGFRAPDLLVNNARNGDVGLLTKYISSYVASTEGVRAVTNIRAYYNDHVLTFVCTVLTGEGEEGQVEVNVNGLL